MAETIWTTGELLDRIQRRSPFFIFDVRNREEFERSQIEGRGPLASINVPYFEMLEQGGKDEMVDSIVAYAERDLVSVLPKEMPILTVCAKGETAVYVAEGLSQLDYSCAVLEGGAAAWSNHYDVRTLFEEADRAVHQVSRPARGCVSWIVESGGRALVIDPLRHIDPYVALARRRGFAIETVLDTHGHADHISGGPALAAQSGAAYFLHPYDAIHPVDVLPPQIAFENLRDGQTIRVGAVELNVIHIPGHTLGQVALRMEDCCLFAGDSIFIRSISRPDLGGKADTWAPLHARSLRKLLLLPEEILVLPGHFSSLDELNDEGFCAATLRELKTKNEGIAALLEESEEGFVRFLLAGLPPPVAEYTDIKRVNAGLRSVNEEDASTLECGKNICALSKA
jgi:glyoxylase-like metal-dependent hydrolase (beta-lactamase superfamily II)/rhodanese-related sulfurtransferase